MEERKEFALREWNSGHPALGPSLYRVSYLSFEEFSF
jgi:hypothetical protein